MNIFKSPALKDLDPGAYHFFGLWKQNLFSEGFWVCNWNKEIIGKLGITAEELGILILGEGNFFVKNSELDNIKKQIYQKIDEHDEAFFKNMVAVADREYKAALEYGKTIKDKKLTPEDFSEFVTVARRVNLLWFLGAEQFSEAAQAKLSDVVVAESFASEKVSDIIPKFNTPLNDQNKEVLEFKKELGNKSLAEIKNDSALYAKLSDHVGRYAWIETANFVGEPFTIEKLYDQIIHAKDEPVVATKNDYQVSPNLAFHALCLSYCGYIRQAGAEYFFMLSEKAQPYLKSIGEKFGLTYPELLLQRDVEILGALKGNVSIDELKANAKRREKMNVVTFAGVGGDVFFIEEPEDIEILRQVMLPKANEADTEIRGQVGNKGKYTGPARIIMNTHDFSKMQSGDVLVSTMTTPDFLVLMHKAGAIVTDIGGMLCHAAIVSREINKPCVIGTKFATQILKDGDMVEVDADKGIIRKI
jgi:phosphohistidine swiveling domain-containing protein